MLAGLFALCESSVVVDFRSAMGSGEADCEVAELAKSFGQGRLPKVLTTFAT
jgi:hypothetical protein